MLMLTQSYSCLCIPDVPCQPFVVPRSSGVANLRSINPIFKHFRPLFKVSGPVMNGEKLAMLDFERRDRILTP